MCQQLRRDIYRPERCAGPTAKHPAPTLQKSSWEHTGKHQQLPARCYISRRVQETNSYQMSLSLRAQSPLMSKRTDEGNLASSVKLMFASPLPGSLAHSGQPGPDCSNTIPSHTHLENESNRERWRWALPLSWMLLPLCFAVYPRAKLLSVWRNTESTWGPSYPETYTELKLIQHELLTFLFISKNKGLWIKLTKAQGKNYTLLQYWENK